MKKTNMIGWAAVILVTSASGFWAFWGTNEAFHEGWCSPTLAMRILQVFAYVGPGWTRAGLANWEESMNTAYFLKEDGTTLADQPQHIWRLPTREELVRSLTRANQNAGGVWDSERQRATYVRRPDKESPLWDSHAPLIYMWTFEEADNDRAWIVVYHGGVFSKPKLTGSPSFGFRAVKNTPSPSTLSQ